MGGEKFLVGLRGAKHFSIAFRIFLANSEVSKRGWREGVGDRQTPKKSPKSSPEMCAPSPKGA